MKELLDKLSSYNIFNYLFPGVIFVIILSKVTPYNFIQENIIVGAFFYFFIGLVISRIGSLIIEPFLKSISFLRFAEYAQFVKKSKIDSKIEALSESNNMYRTICSVLTLVLLGKLYEKISVKLNIPEELASTVVLIILLILFLFSYKKQTDYIRKRIEANDEK